MGNLVLAGAVAPDGGYDRAGQVGHAWLWDPLFLVWGIALVVGLLRLRTSDGTGPGVGTQAAAGSTSEMAQTSGPKTS